jgi:hypothetical protein
VRCRACGSRRKCSPPSSCAPRSSSWAALAHRLDDGVVVTRTVVQALQARHADRARSSGGDAELCRHPRWPRPGRMLSAGGEAARVRGRCLRRGAPSLVLPSVDALEHGASLVPGIERRHRLQSPFETCSHTHAPPSPHSGRGLLRKSARDEWPLAPEMHACPHGSAVSSRPWWTHDCSRCLRPPDP